MKKLVLVAVVFVFLFAVVGTAIAQYEWDSNTALLDNFDGTTVGTAFGPITYGDSLPVLGQAINLVTTSYVKYALPSWGGVQGTVEMWINPRQYGLNEGWPPILTLQWFDVTSPPSSGYVAGFYLNPEGKLGWWVWNGYGDGSVAGITTIPLNEWTHIAVSWGPDGTKLYVNGVVDASTSANLWPALSSPTYAYLNFWGQYDLGYVDELRISKVARSEEEIRDYVASFLVKTVTTEAATDVTPTNAQLNGLNGDLYADNYSFHVSLVPDMTAEDYWTGPLGPVDTNAAFSTTLASFVPTVTPNTTYYFVAYVSVGGTWYQGEVLQFTTLDTYTCTATFVDWDATVLYISAVDYDTAATAPADPIRTGYTFAGWDVDFSHVKADMTVTATYTINTVTTEAATDVTPTNAQLNGLNGDLYADNYSFHVSLDPDFPEDGTYYSGHLGPVDANAAFSTTLASFVPTVTPNTTYYFIAYVWFGDTVHQGEVLEFTTLNTYTLTVNKVSSGTVTVNPAGGTYDYGTVVTLTASPGTGWHFVSWSGDATGTALTTTVTMDGNKTVTATFAINTGTLTIDIGIIDDPDSLGFLDSTVIGANVRGAIFASLIGFTPDGKPYPDLLEKVPSVDDGTIQINTSHNTMTVTYMLKKGLEWSDGESITSHDFYFTWLMMNNGNINFPSRDPYDKITSVETQGNLTFITHWNEINILEAFYISIYPSHILEPIYNNNPKDIETCSYNAMPIHAGPYKIVEWNKDNYISLVRNPYYYGNTPQIDGVVFKIFNGDTTAMMGAVLAGTIDLLAPASLQITGINYLKANSAESNYNILFVEGIFWEHLAFNMDDPIVGDSNNPVLRKALMYAINKQEIIDTVFGISRSVANVNMVEKGSIYYNPNADIYSYNFLYARQILQNAGYSWDADGHLRKPTGELVQITLETTATVVGRGEEAQMICNYWSTIGVVANYVQLDYSYFFGYCLPHRDFQVGMFAWGGNVAELSFLLYNSSQIPASSNNYSEQNYAGFVSPELDTLENQMNKISFINDFSLAYQIESILADKIPELPLNWWGDSLVVNKTLQGINYPISSSIPITWNIQDWYVGTPQTLSITTDSTLPNGTVNIPYLKFLDATGGVMYKKFSIISGNLPSGLILNQSGTIAGTPTQSGTFNFTAKVEDYAGNYTTKAFSITIAPTPTLTIDYWKTHAGFTGKNPNKVTPLLPISMGSITVTSASDAVRYLSMNGDASNGINKLLAQLLGAKLNIENGTDGSAVSAVISAADSFLTIYGPSSWDSLSKAQRQQVLEWTSTLDDYNNGRPGHRP
jgi:peptide/nickel transport system substrate-binding protein